MRHKKVIFILLLYIILSIVQTYPLILNFNSCIPSDARYFQNYFSDAFQFFWNLWWFERAITKGKDPYYCDLIYYPIGLNLIFHTLIPFTGFLFTVIHFFLPLIASYNLLFLLMIFLNCAGGFFLGRYLLKDDISAFFSGFIYGFSPYVMYRSLCHLNMMALYPIPFFIYFLLKTVEEKRTFNPIMAGIFLGISGLVSDYYLLFILIFLFYFLLYNLLSKGYKFIFSNAKKLALLLLIGLIFLLPIIIKISKEVLKEGNYVRVFFVQGTDLVSLFIPGILNPIFGGRISSLFPGDPESWSLYTGYSVLFLSLYSVFRHFRDKNVRFWAIFLIFVLTLMLGPAIRIAGKNYMKFLPLPFHLLMKIPILNAIRVASRFSALLTLSLAILAAYGFKNFKDKIKILKHKNIATCFASILFVVIFLEYLSFPYPLADIRPIKGYEMIARENGDFVVMEFPMIRRPANITQVYQCFHQKKVLFTHISYFPDWVEEYYKKMPIIGELLKLQVKQEIYPEFKPVDPALLSKVLNFLKVKYIIFHIQQLPFTGLSYIRDFLAPAADQFEILRGDKNLIILKFTKEVPPQYKTVIEPSDELGELNLLNGWRQGWSKDVEKNCLFISSNKAEIIFKAKKGKRHLLIFKAFVFGQALKNEISLHLKLNRKNLSDLPINRKAMDYQIEIPTSFLVEDINLLSFVIKDKEKWQNLEIGFEKILITPIDIPIDIE